MADPDIPATPSPYTGGINHTYPGSQQPISTTKMPFVESGTQGKGFARGWLRPVVDYLTGRTKAHAGATAFVKPDGAREGVINTGVDLQTGPSPVGITRIHTQKLGGYTGPSAGGDTPGQIGLSMTGSLFIPHQNIDRRDAGKISRAVPGGGVAVDDGAHIPAIYAGNAPASNG